MIAVDLLESLRSQLCREIDVYSVTPEQIAISLPLSFPDGDRCGVYCRQLEAGRWSLTDHGQTLRRVAEAGYDPTATPYAEQVQQVVDFFGLHQAGSALVADVSTEELPQTVFALSQVAIELSTLGRRLESTPRRERPNFKQLVHELIHESVPDELLTDNYHDLEIDPGRMHTIDFRIALPGEDVFLFPVQTTLNCLVTTVSCQHFALHRNDRTVSRPYRSVILYDDEGELPKRYTTPLNELAARTFPRIREKKAIREFLRSLAA